MGCAAPARTKKYQVRILSFINIANNERLLWRASADERLVVLLLEQHGEMGNALEAPVTEKDTIRFERAATALKVSNLWIFFCFACPAHPPSGDVSRLTQLARLSHRATVTYFDGLG